MDSMIRLRICSDAKCCEAFAQAVSSPASQTDPGNTANDPWEEDFYQTDPDFGAGSPSAEMGRIPPEDTSAPPDMLGEAQASQPLPGTSLLSAATSDLDELRARPITVANHLLATDQGEFCFTF